MPEIEAREAEARGKKLNRVCKTSEPSQRIVSFTAEIGVGIILATQRGSNPRELSC